METSPINHKKGLFAISPLLLFVLLYVVASVIAGDFYCMPITIAFLMSCIYSVATFNGKTLKERLDVFCNGAGDKDIMFMLCIFVLAGAFANSAKIAGCVDDTVNFTLNVLPDSMVMPGLFLSACFISLSIGTSVGTIVALVPIAAGLANTIGSDVASMVAIIVGGSFFGDNLSFISDTTIVATNTQKCRMSDKFLVNSYIAIPAALVVLLLYIYLGQGMHTHRDIVDVNYFNMLPYIIVIVTALCGLNVVVVLTLGLVSTGVLGIAFSHYDFFGWCHAMGDGISSMGELIVVSVLAGGLLRILKENGALEYLIRLMTLKITNRRSCEMTIAMLVSLVNVCTANNTVAILTVGTISKEIGDRYGVDNRKNASILDTFSCCIQSILPYGAQILMATGLALVNPIDIIGKLYYPFILFGVSVWAILFRYPRKFS